MAKVFAVNDSLSNKPNRNNFDLTHKVHGSYKMGVLYPFLCKPVVPGDSFRITNECSFRFTPMPFPTQSNMRVIFHYFYVRNKNLWSGFENWIEELEEHEPPYVYQPATFYHNGSLADYLDIPTSFVSGPEHLSVENSLFFADKDMSDLNSFPSSWPLFRLSVYLQPTVLVGDDFNSNYTVYNQSNDTGVSRLYLFDVFNSGTRTHFLASTLVDSLAFHYIINSTSNFDVSNTGVYLLYVENNRIVAVQDFGVFDFTSGESFTSSSVSSVSIGFSNAKVYLGLRYTSSGNAPTFTNRLYGGFKKIVDFKMNYTSLPSSKQVSDGGVSCPYYGISNTSSNSIRVSALPFRAYESIYHAFYRDNHGVQPFMINGVEQFNKYNTTTGDGQDTTDYHLFRRNWEMDAYTSCLISPMQGETPLVGVNSFDVDSLGRMSVEMDDGSTASLQLRDLEDGQQGVAYENLNATSDQARQFVLRAASMGFSIPDFRQVNAYTRWKELNIRKGTRYLDFIFGHHNVKPKYKELDMPEFLGGFTERVSVNDISNTNGGTSADELGDTLGAIAGQARAIGGSKHGVNHYFDDYGFVVGIMCIVPDNAYDSVLPKHFNLKSPLDMYFPEFSQLSMQPLTHEELCPVQTINDPRGSAYRDMTKVFGYQRPNHELVWACDTVHGLFRDASGIGNSVICRRFGSRPELGTNFLQIKSEETDTIFNYTFGDDDICLGEIVVKIQAKRPVPYLVVPSIK